jgi:hypothetical protein
VLQIIRHWYLLRRLFESIESITTAPVQTTRSPPRPTSPRKSKSATATTATTTATATISTAEEEADELVSTMVSQLPVATPLLISRSTAVVAGSAWAKQNYALIDDFHQGLKSRVSYCLEAIISRVELKKVLGSLKALMMTTLQKRSSIAHARATEAADVDSGENEDEQRALDAHWVVVLKEFRDVWACLTDSTCMFMNK